MAQSHKSETALWQASPINIANQILIIIIIIIAINSIVWIEMVVIKRDQ